MIIIPAIDLKGGVCVRLQQGDMNKADVYGEDVLAVAQRWVDSGAKRLHMVDLDGAFASKPVNLDIIERVCAHFPDLPVQVGGGIREIGTAEHYFDLGVQWCIIGTKAVSDFSFLETITQQFPGQIILGIDAKEGMVAVEGWAQLSTQRAIDMAQRCRDLPLAAIVYTDIARDGMLSGVNVERTVEMAQAASCPVIASGGVKNIEDIRMLAPYTSVGILGAIAGRAIYTGDLDLGEAQRLADNLC